MSDADTIRRTWAELQARHTWPFDGPETISAAPRMPPMAASWRPEPVALEPIRPVRFRRVLLRHSVTWERAFAIFGRYGDTEIQVDGPDVPQEGQP